MKIAGEFRADRVAGADLEHAVDGMKAEEIIDRRPKSSRWPKALRPDG